MTASRQRLRQLSRQRSRQLRGVRRIATMRALFVDLDRTFLRKASGPILNRALQDEGLLPTGRSVPAQDLLYKVYDAFGETLLFIGFARAAALVARGWSQEAVRHAGKRAANELSSLIAPFAPGRLSEYKARGFKLVLATTTPSDMIEDFARQHGFDEVVATRYEVRDGRYTGRIEGDFVWGPGKLRAVERWAAKKGVELSCSAAFSDSFFDQPLLCKVGEPRVVNPDPRLLAVALVRGWPVENWDRPPGVPSLAGVEPYHVLRRVVVPELFPYARFEFTGIENLPESGAFIMAANHRSYFDAIALALLVAKLGRPVRFLAKQELFQAPLLGRIVASLGGIRVDREGNPAQALRCAEQVLLAGEGVLLFPQGTIPRGEEFQDPVLRGKTGVVRLARATGAAVYPVGVWGTERVWPRDARVPRIANVMRPPLVQVRVGPALRLGKGDLRAETARIMEAISELLPRGRETVLDVVSDQEGP
jgi:putative phosphoserine phosphatase/1-acylglycerol-3-phosphate O-acyltransferase